MLADLKSIESKISKLWENHRSSIKTLTTKFINEIKFDIQAYANSLEGKLDSDNEVIDVEYFHKVLKVSIENSIFYRWSNVVF